MVLADRRWSQFRGYLSLYMAGVMVGVTAESGAVKWVPRADNVFKEDRGGMDNHRTGAAERI